MARPKLQSAANSVGIKELKDRASSIVDRVQKTKRAVLITNNGMAVARIEPLSQENGGWNLSRQLEELGLLASPKRYSLADVQLEKISLTDARVAIETILSDRGED